MYEQCFGLKAKCWIYRTKNRWVAQGGMRHHSTRRTNGDGRRIWGGYWIWERAEQLDSNRREGILRGAGEGWEPGLGHTHAIAQWRH